MREGVGARPPSSERRFLFLQGPASPFFENLARELADRGHGIRRINLCAGDKSFWRLSSIGYRGAFENWRSFLHDYIFEQRITDIILFGDCRPYHRVAIELGKFHQVPVHVFEEGYLRPNWITIEQGGVNGHSSLPRDPDTLRRMAAEAPAVADAPVSQRFLFRACWDVFYNACSVIGGFLYPRYRRHRLRHPLVEYAGWLGRILRLRATRKRAAQQIHRLLAHPGGYFLVPLQLDDDYQIRVHSRFSSNESFLRETIASFARFAPAESELLVKVHPLDNGLIDRERQVRAIAAKFGIEHRVTCIEGGHLPTLLEASRGVVLVNSTVGTSAMHHNRPTIALGKAVYNMPGLTFQDPLDRFWREGTEPDRSLYDAFIRLVAHQTQINGGFFSPSGIALCMKSAAERICGVQPRVWAAALHVEAPVVEGDLALVKPILSGD